MFTGVAPGGALEGTGISPSGEAARKQQGAQFILLGKKKKNSSTRFQFYSLPKTLIGDALLAESTTVRSSEFTSPVQHTAVLFLLPNDRSATIANARVWVCCTFLLAFYFDSSCRVEWVLLN